MFVKKHSISVFLLNFAFREIEQVLVSHKSDRKYFLSSVLNVGELEETATSKYSEGSFIIPL